MVVAVMAYLGPDWIDGGELLELEGVERRVCSAELLKSNLLLPGWSLVQKTRREDYVHGHSCVRTRF